MDVLVRRQRGRGEEGQRGEPFDDAVLILDDMFMLMCFVLYHPYVT